MGRYQVTFASFMMVMTTYSYADMERNKGVFGEVGLGLGKFTAKENLSTDGDEIIAELGSASSESEVSSDVVLALGYAFNSNHLLYIGTHNEELINSEVSLATGYQYTTDNGLSLDISYLYGVFHDDTWQDPYLVGSAREKTDIKESALRFQVEGINGSPLSLDSLLYSKQIEFEAVKDPQLERSGNGIWAQTAYSYPLNESSFVIPSLYLDAFSADGEAMSFKEYGIGLEYLHSAGSHSFTLAAEYGLRHYDAENVIFERTQRDERFEFSLLYQFEGFMGLDNVSLIGLASYEETLSNIDFYDSNEIEILLGVSYRF
ncbi:DUF2860 family protein [Photobacterium sp. BZF1]|uniref:DUF2860 family protein n=1 Tax=Photobacterium sp. BZF1 TaxID=1904457 RepID=UPI001653EDBD|nr:DUF2860 family protein [Photobacterium sp. BZF1]MBC7004482.1 DUF2860 family protein [Photobacterium sp. BZF1]